MKKYIALLFAVFSIAQGLRAQSYIGVKGGISIPNLTAGGSDNNPLNTGYGSRLGPDFGIFYEGHLSKLFSLTTQLEYSAQGGKKDGFQALTTPAGLAALFQQLGEPAPDFLYATYNSEARINYLMLSELAKVSFALGAKSPLSIYVDAGPFAGLLVSAHQVTSGSSDIYADAKKQMDLTQLSQQPAASFNDNTDIKDQLHKGNVGVEGDLGLALLLGKSKVFVEGGGNYGFLNIQKGTENGKNHIGAAVVRLGYGFNFGRVRAAKTHA